MTPRFGSWRRRFAGACLVALAVGAATWLPARAETPPSLNSAIDNPDRPAADRARDANRHPLQVLEFAGIVPGEKVADIMPGTGYFTRIFSNAVGPKGHVYAIVPAELAAKAPKVLAAIQTAVKDPALANVSVLTMPTAAIAAPEKLDLAWTSDNYHDVYGFFGAEQAAAMDRAVFAALKPGGEFIVVDHVAKAGSGGADATTLHRIDPATVKAQVLAAGFTLDAESTMLQNPNDSHAEKVFAPDIRGRTDQFVFKFRKPRQ
jgi:predicted methyltransferase